MQLPKRRFPAPPRESILRPALWLLVFLFSASVISFFGCARRIHNLRQFFGSTSSEPPSEQAMATEIATPSATPTPTTPSSQSHAHKKSCKDVHVAVEKASEASESATEASEKAQQASKEARQAADAASRAEQEGGSASSKSIMSLEASPLPFSGGTPAAAVTIAAIPGSTPAARPTLGLEGAPTASPSPPDATTAAEPALTEAEKLIGEVNNIEKRIDRKNINADETRH